MIENAMMDQKYSGTYNATAPEPITTKTLVKAVKDAKSGLGVLLPVPSFALKLALGEMAQILTYSTRAIPSRLIEQGHDFLYTDVGTAIKDILNRNV